MSDEKVMIYKCPGVSESRDEHVSLKDYTHLATHVKELEDIADAAKQLSNNLNAMCVQCCGGLQHAQPADLIVSVNEKHEVLIEALKKAGYLE